MRILDLACNDGWLLANLWTGQDELSEFERLDGIELNSGAAERAQERQQKWGWPGEIVEADLFTAPEHFEPGSYDAVVCFETIEHVPDPRALLRLMKAMAKPEGSRLYVSTPAGAFERGNIPAWFRVEQKGHLRAMRPHDLAELLCELGIVREFQLGQGLAVAAVEPAPRKGRIVFYCGLAEARPELIATTGLGGSETAVCKMAEHFARRGYDVRVYQGGPEGEGGLRGDYQSVEAEKLTGQVLYAPASEWNPGEEADLFVSVRMPEALDRTIAAKRRLLWLHDADYGDRLTEERVSRATAVVVMSKFQRDLLESAYPFLAELDRTFVSRNGIESSYFGEVRLFEKRKPWVVYTSSPDRGLDVLFECWPEIRRRAQEEGIGPVLHHAYAPFYHQARERFPHLQAFHRRLEAARDRAGEGIVDRGAMSQKEIAELYSQAAVWAYPSWTTPSSEPFPEISCISAMEAQAGGAWPVCLKHGALVETVEHGDLIDPHVVGDELSATWRTQFIERVVEALAPNGRTIDAQRRDNREYALGLDWSGVCDEWEAAFLGVEAELDPREEAAIGGPVE